jgi:cyclic nucleotide gated channel alpha 1
VTYIHTQKFKLLWHCTKIIIFNFILAHIVSVILLGISNFDVHNSWIVKYGIYGQPWYVLYLYAYYWGSIIITTVGFGDISAGNWREALVVVVIVMFACVILGFNIS